MYEHLQNIPQSITDISPIEPGAMAPGAVLKAMDGTSTTLRSIFDKGPSILVIYRGGWCPYCTLHLKNLKDVVPTLTDMGFQTIGVTPDLPCFLREDERRFDIGFQIFSDSELRLARAYGVAYREDPQQVAWLKDNNKDIEARSGESHHALPVPSVFLIDENHKVRFVYANPDIRVRLEPGELLRTAREIAGSAPSLPFVAR